MQAVQVSGLGDVVWVVTEQGSVFVRSGICSSSVGAHWSQLSVEQFRSAL